MKSLTELFKENFLTKFLDARQHQLLSNAMQKKYFKTGEVIIRYGDIGNEYYVLSYGTCKVTIYIKGTKPEDPQLETKIDFIKTIKAYPDQESPQPMIGFGEIALLYDDQRTASVTALTNCEAWVLSGNIFKHIIAAH